MRVSGVTTLLKNLLVAVILSSTLLPAQNSRAMQLSPPITLEGVQRLIHERGGKVLFLNLWATWCQPCVHEFPDIAKLRRAYPDSMLDVVAISVDYPDEAESKIIPLLERLQSPFTVYVADVKKQEDLINALDPTWSGAVPATFVYDRRGKRHAFLLGQKSLETFKAEVDSALTAR